MNFFRWLNPRNWFNRERKKSEDAAAVQEIRQVDPIGKFVPLLPVPVKSRKAKRRQDWRAKMRWAQKRARIRRAERQTR